MSIPVSFISDVNGYFGEVKLYNVIGTDEYFIVSAVDEPFLCETLIFESDSNGNVLSYYEKPGSFKGAADHEQALLRGGYVNINDENVIDSEAIVIAGELEA